MAYHAHDKRFAVSCCHNLLPTACFTLFDQAPDILQSSNVMHLNFIFVFLAYLTFIPLQSQR
jgi:hypothetical protein